MSFDITWPQFDEEMINMVKDKLNGILNSSTPGEPSPLPEELVAPLVVTGISFGTIAPELEVVDISDIQEERFQGGLKIRYEGDLFLELSTAVEVNACVEKRPKDRRYVQSIHSDVLTEPLHIPLKIMISKIKLSGILQASFTKKPSHEGLTASKQTGPIAAYFEGDPLVSVCVTSNFDGLSPVKNLLQSTIEDFLRTFFQQDFPNLIRKLSTMLNLD
eukprot:TRINITY_DN3891_c0_g1_i1.p1 TRINITY_DN3891_c0_g1~~TRINITY_DN3891_c0_g1_i1.p1  ORF type:complete len:218 (+),score=27.08 TRINITY_DN3891_c0_g1_i1:147-800(+)